MNTTAAIIQTRADLAILLASRPTPATERAIRDVRRLLADLGGTQNVSRMAPEFCPPLTDMDALRRYHCNAKVGSRRVIQALCPEMPAELLQYHIPDGKSEFFGVDLVEVSGILASLYKCGEGAGEGARRLTCYLRDNPQAPEAVWSLLADMQDAHRAASLRAAA